MTEGVLEDNGVAGDTATVGGAPADLAIFAVDAVGADERVDVGGAHCCGGGGVLGSGVGCDSEVNPGVWGNDDLSFYTGFLVAMARGSVPVRRRCRGECVSW